MSERYGKVFEGVEEGVWRIFDEGSEVRKGVEVMKNGGGSQKSPCEQYRDRSSGTGTRWKMRKWEERERKS